MNKKISFIAELLNSNKINASQKERLLLLATDEIKKVADCEDIIFAEIADLKKSIQKIKIEHKIQLNEEYDSQVNSIIVKEKSDYKIPETSKKSSLENNSQHEEKASKDLPIIKHDTNNTVEILKKFKYRNESGLKELVHKPNDSENFTIKDYDVIIEESAAYFKSIKNIPVDMYYNIKELILLMSVQGRKLVIETNEHPYLNNLSTKIDATILIEKYKNISDSGGTFTISTIIQNFKRKYRFDNESTEATVLKELIKNVFNFNKQVYLREDKLYYTFKGKEKLELNEQVIIDLHFLNDSQFNSKASFFTWVPNIKKALNMIAADILKHSNLKGASSFKSQEKQITIDIAREYNELRGWTEICLTILDKNTYCDRDPTDLSKLIEGEYKSLFTSVCDWRIEYDKNQYDSYLIEFLPSNNGNKKLDQEVGGFKHILTFYD